MSVDVNVEKGIAEVLLNKPPVNAFDSKEWVQLAELFTSLGRDENVRVVLVAAEGRGFCAGVDIKELAADSTAITKVNKGCYDTFAAIHDCPVPVIAAAHGFVLGGGIGIVGSCDVIYASEDATFGLPDPTEEDTARAAACAIALQLEMEAINERNATSQLPEVEIGVGVATGPVVVGGFGSGDAMRFKAIGEPLLWAPRIEAAGEGGEVWICDATRARLGELARVDRQRSVDGQGVHRLLGVGGEWLMTLRAVPGAGEN